MTRVLVQIYEIQNPREADAVAALGVDHIGTVLLSPEDRQVPVLRETVRTVQGAGAVSGLIPLFGDRETVFHALDYYRPDYVHFCEILSPFPNASEAASRKCESLLYLQRAVRESFPDIRIMRSLSVPQPGPEQDRGVLDHLLSYTRMFTLLSDFLLIDTLRGCPEAVADQPVNGFVGITGEICDWNLAAWIVSESPLPVILAGGIGPDNVRQAILAVQPAGVDSCTRTNALDDRGRPIRFQKDLRKVKRLVEEARDMSEGRQY